MKTFNASAQPVKDIESLSYKGQDPNMKMYRYGYETFFNHMPILQSGDPLLKQKIEFSKITMQGLAKELAGAQWLKRINPGKGEFKRTIVAINPPEVDIHGGLKGGAEFAVGSWGDSFTTPVHGHAPGYIHEELINGMMRVNTYRQLEGGMRIARPIKTEMKYPGTIVSMYAQPTFDNQYNRTTLIHNFTAIGSSNTLHFLPEFTRDGRDNTFNVEYFDQHFPLAKHVHRINSRDGMYLRIGDVVLVRSENVPEYGDHYIIITGHPIVKAHGLRPQDVAISAPTAKMLLDAYPTETGLTLLKLDEEATKEFIRFHQITLTGEEVKFATA